MCILFVAVNQHPDYPLIIAANRDEFYERPTRASHYWTQHEHVLAGIDEQAGGTWMGVNKQGYIAALTNIRDPKKQNKHAISRGFLASDYLISSPSIEDYLNYIRNERASYNGYNLLFGHWQNLHVYNNHLDTVEALSKGVYGLSNATLNTPWPKLNKGMTQLESYCQPGHTISPEHLFSLLKDGELAPDHHLPQTGVPIEWERRLSSIFIRGHDYATRSSTVLLIDKHQHLQWTERTYNQEAECVGEQNYQFNII